MARRLALIPRVRRVVLEVRLPAWLLLERGVVEDG